MNRKSYWDSIYANKTGSTLSWYQQHPRRSLDLINRTALPRNARVIDVGGGDSRLVDDLLREGYSDVTVLDLSRAALNRARTRLGSASADQVAWIEGDILEAKLPRGAFDAIYHVPSGLVTAHIGLLIQRAREDKVGLMAHEDEVVAAGALVSYGANYRRMGQQTARIVDRVLGGVAPAEIPIQVPDKLMLAINLVTARTIGLRPPLTLLERAERIVE